MPREGQIIPEYKVPHVKTYINDNSVYEDVSTVVSETGIRFLSVFASEKGEDGVVKMIRSAAEYIDEYGTPNYELYGQPSYMPYVALQSGNARCWCMRVMPTDATYANIALIAKVKVADTTTIHASNGVNIDPMNGDTPSATMANNADKIIVGEFAKADTNMSVTVKGKAPLETVDLMSDADAHPGQWFGVIIDTGFEIPGSTYVSKHGTMYTMGINDLKESAAAGGKEFEEHQVTVNGTTQTIYAIKGTYEEITDEAGNIVQVNYEPYTQFVQWVNVAVDADGNPVEPGTIKSTEMIDGVSRTVYTRVVEVRNKSAIPTYITIKFVPYVDGEIVSEFDKFDIKYETRAIEGFNDRDSLKLALENVVYAEGVSEPAEGELYPVVDGYTEIPVMAVCSKGRGEYGNSLRIRVTQDLGADKDNEYKNYIIEVLTNDTTLVRKEYFKVSICEDAVIDATSLYADDIINDVNSGSTKIELMVNPEAFKYIYDLYTTEVAPFLSEAEQALVPAFEAFDFLFGNVKNKNVRIPSFAISESVPFSSPDGIALVNGDDGSFSAMNPDRQIAMDRAYVEAFTPPHPDVVDTTERLYSKAIFSKRRTPCEFILDANYNYEDEMGDPSRNVKGALVQLAKYRYDAQLILDATINCTTISNAIDWSTKMLSIADPIISKECSSYKIKDPFNGKTITVTSTYNMAKLLPNHWATYGNHIPFVGTNYSLLVDYVKNSIKPAIDADDMAVKETLYNNHVNFYECIAENRFIKGTQTTSQDISSDLSEMNNVAVMLEMKRKLEDYVSRQIYNFSDASERARFTADADELFIGYSNKKVKSYNVYFDMNEFEEKRNILHCYLTIVFRTMAKRGIIEIDINKRS